MAYVIPPTRAVRIKKNNHLTKKRVDKMLARIDMKEKIVFGIEKQVWDDTKRVEAVNLFLIYGDMRKVESLTGIPLNTLRDWRKFKPWWKELENVLKEEHDIGVAGELTSVVENTIRAISDRVINGDFVYNARSGDITRVPVKAADLGKIASAMIDKKLTLQKQPTKYTATTDNKVELNNKLETLAKSFADFTSGRAAKVLQNDQKAIEDAMILGE